MTDPTQYRQDSRARWGRSARRWAARREQFARASMPVSNRMIELVAPQPGHALLELAAGIGDLGFLALVQPGGTLITSDFSPDAVPPDHLHALGVELRGEGRSRRSFKGAQARCRSPGGVFNR